MLHYNTRTVPLKVQFYRPSKLDWTLKGEKMPPITLSIEPDRLWYDDDGIVRNFAYTNSNGNLLEFIGKDESSSANNWKRNKAIAEQSIDYVTDILMYRNLLIRGGHYYEQYNSKELNAREIVEDASIWFAFKQFKKEIRKFGINQAEKAIKKIFPKIAQPKNMVYRETNYNAFMHYGVLEV